MDLIVVSTVLLFALFINGILSFLVINKLDEEEEESGRLTWSFWLVIIILSTLASFFNLNEMAGSNILFTLVLFFMTYGLIPIALFFYNKDSVGYHINLISYMLTFFLSIYSSVEERLNIISLLVVLLVPFFMVFELILAIKTLWLHSKIKEKRSKQKVARNKKGTKRRVSPVKGNTKRPIRRPVRAKRPPARPK